MSQQQHKWVSSYHKGRVKRLLPPGVTILSLLDNNTLGIDLSINITLVLGKPGRESNKINNPLGADSYAQFEPFVFSLDSTIQSLDTYLAENGLRRQIGLTNMSLPLLSFKNSAPASKIGLDRIGKPQDELVEIHNNNDFRNVVEQEGLVLTSELSTFAEEDVIEINLNLQAAVEKVTTPRPRPSNNNNKNKTSSAKKSAPRDSLSDSSSSSDSDGNQAKKRRITPTTTTTTTTTTTRPKAGLPVGGQITALNVQVICSTYEKQEGEQYKAATSVLASLKVTFNNSKITLSQLKAESLLALYKSHLTKNISAASTLFVQTRYSNVSPVTTTEELVKQLLWKASNHQPTKQTIVSNNNNGFSMNCNFSFGAMQSSESQVSPEYLSMLNDNFAGENNANFEGITSAAAVTSLSQEEITEPAPPPESAAVTSKLSRTNNRNISAKILLLQTSQASPFYNAISLQHFDFIESHFESQMTEVSFRRAIDGNWTEDGIPAIITTTIQALNFESGGLTALLKNSHPLLPKGGFRNMTTNNSDATNNNSNNNNEIVRLLAEVVKSKTDNNNNNAPPSASSSGVVDRKAVRFARKDNLDTVFEAILESSDVRSVSTLCNTLGPETLKTLLQDANGKMKPGSVAQFSLLVKDGQFIALSFDDSKMGSGKFSFENLLARNDLRGNSIVFSVALVDKVVVTDADMANMQTFFA